MSKSKAEKELELQLSLNNIEFKREYIFHPTRKWRFDFVIKEFNLAIEVEGITHFGKNKNGSMRLGRHQTAKGMEGDFIKYSEAMKLGWSVYRCSPAMVKSGYALQTILILINLRKQLK